MECPMVFQQKSGRIPAVFYYECKKDRTILSHDTFRIMFKYINNYNDS
jgi:hypothetical protein